MDNEEIIHLTLCTRVRAWSIRTERGTEYYIASLKAQCKAENKQKIAASITKEKAPDFELE